MAKRSRKKTNERKDFQKVKFKVGKKKPLGLNATDTAFKSKGVTILAQFQTSSATVTSSRGLGIKEICSLLSHRQYSKRAYAFAELSNFLEQHQAQAVEHLGELLNAVLPRLLDEDKKLRSRSYAALHSIFVGENTKGVLEPFASLIINYIICGLTHINAAIAEQSLEAVDLVTRFLPLTNSLDEAAKLITALMSMISSPGEHQKKKKSTIRLLSIGDFSAKPARILVLVRLRAVVEIACTVEARRSLGEEIVMWDITEPNSFVLRSNLAIDMEPRPVIWSSPTLRSTAAPGSAAATKNQSPLESLTASLLNVTKFINVFWPTVADQYGESTIMFEDLAGRRCCQDLLKSMLAFYTHLFVDEEKFDINSLSEAFLEAIKTVTGQNPLSQKVITKSRGTPKGYYSHIAAFAELVVSRDDEGNRQRGYMGVDLLNANALALLKVYQQFVVDTRGSPELLSKLKHEVTKLEKYMRSLPAEKAPRPSKRKLSESEGAENIPVFDYSINSVSADWDAVLLDHCYGERAQQMVVEECVGMEVGDMPVPLVGDADVL
ncbi:hypothetical protein BV898_15415 [Hypsibius exemplaris]|uniref:Pre-rRNA-processing protein Ipi1 N-terminal domain-containing protein n=1 Tax=Hypsibius exemplaris TaxID=2072580 RepID=A0A9X6RKB4_HYPEX|nr:hypothetical protein BV898_15415 [Hypsibius exemplaris]